MKAGVKWIEDLKFFGKTDKNQYFTLVGSDIAYLSPIEMANL
ncbi:hypothetical protein [Vibrio diabolicus]|nr:hypothetical protein [Vibrio parahaemolyticus]